ncbi:MAG: translation initiation factor IF-2 [Planctomycetota bacterium]
MAVRIYAFAKDLGIDNKQLLDICERAGIKGKGSALASLDDAEIATIKAFMAGDSSNGSSAAAAPTRDEAPEAPAAPTRNSILPSTNKVLKDLNTKPTRPAVPKPSTETPVTPEPTPVASTPASSTPAPSTPASSTPAAASPVAEPPRVEEKPKPKPKPKPRQRPKKPDVVFNVASMPEVKQPTMKQAAPEEKVQRPDIALPKDAIKKVQSGAAPLQQFTDKATKEKKPKKGKRDAAPANNKILGEMPSSGRRSGKRRSTGEAGTNTERSGNTLGSTRQLRSRRPNHRHHRNDFRGGMRRRGRSRGPVANTAAPRKEAAVLQLPCTVKEFSQAAGVPAIKVLMTLQQIGEEANLNINSPMDDEFVELLVDHLGVEIEIREAQSLEDEMLSHFDTEDVDPERLALRPPIVTFLGHVDHGKTSLLDAIIGIDVVSGEAGGITQHIRAYEIHRNDQKIAFVDTPGHEAFTEMRARGANVTDIAVLVVAADDGVMPQTEEAISHAKAAGVPIIVALNKIDLPGANPDKALQDLASHELLPSEWGGDVEVVKTSATQGTGIDELFETILLTAELHEFKADFDREAYGTCLEAEQQSDKGVVAKIMVQDGTLRVGDIVVCGAAHGKVKAMYDTLRPRKKLKEAGPSTPVNLTGLDIAPGAGDKFYVLDDVAKAREIAESREFKSRQRSLSGITTKVSLEEIQRRLEAGNLSDGTEELVTLNLIIRADVRGSIEAIQKELGKIQHPEVRIKVLQALVGGVTVADVRLAQASQAVIIGFNVVPDEAARSLADEVQVEVRRYEVIYKVTDDIKAMLEGRLKPEEQVVEQGMAMVLQVFNISKAGTIAGCRVMRGSILRECRMRVIRDSRVIGDYPIDTLKRVKDDVKEVQRGMECGIKLLNFNDIKEGDTLEAYKIEEIARTL